MAKGFVKYMSAQERAWHKHRKGARRRRRQESQAQRAAVESERRAAILARKVEEGKEMLGVGRKIILLSDNKLVKTINHNGIPHLGGLRKTQTQEEREVR
jgi:hypothetical protein